MLKFFGVTAEKVEKWTADRAVGKLSSALTDKDPVIRRLAAEGMAQIRGSDVLDFCRANAHSPDTNLRWAITQILGMIGSTEAMSILSDVRDPSATIVRTKKKP